MTSLEPEREFETDFRKVMRWATDRLWELDAAEEAMAALHDVMQEARDRAEAVRKAPDGRIAEPPST